jgi:hypothetical protein
MQQFGHARSDERDPQQVAVVQVDDDTGAPGVAVGVEVGARNSLADLTSTILIRDRIPAE